MHEETLLTGRKIPTIGFGTWELTEDTDAIVAKAIGVGYRMIDTSGDYGTQPGVGAGIAQSSIRREELYLITKIEETDDAYDATVKNLQELHLGYADLVLIHRPPNDGVGEELWNGLIQAQEDGLTKDIGVSNYSEDQIRALYAITGVMPVVNQIEWSPFGWSQAMLDFCHEHEILIQGYSPLTRGERLGDAVLMPISQHYDKTPAQIMLRWAQQIGVIPIVKAGQLPHLEENIDLDFTLSDADVVKLCSLNETYSALGKRPAYQLR